MDHFSADSIRQDILTRHASFCMTDVERAKFFGLPEGCRIREGAKIICPEKLKLGKYVWIGENAILDASGGLEIGDHTSIGLGVLIWTHASLWLNQRGHNDKHHSDEITHKPVKIGERCWIGGPSVIAPGVTIGDRCIVMPMSYLTKSLKSQDRWRPDYDLEKRVLALEKQFERDQIG